MPQPQAKVPPSLGGWFANRIATMFGYDNIVDKGKRRQSTIRTVSEDRELGQSGRSQLNANARDQVRNFAVAAWAIRKHLDFVSRFNFDCTSGDGTNAGVKDFDAQIEALMADASVPENWDIAGRHDRCRWLRLFEARACVDGDILGVMLKSGHIQAIEGDRIKNRDASDSDKMTQGVETDLAGRAIAYHVHKRQTYGGLAWERRVAAENCVHHGYFDRFDQVRGISPMAPGLNSLQDVYEGIDYALCKMKVTQLFGLKFTRDAEDSPTGAPLNENGDDETDDETPTGPPYQVTFGNKPVMLDLDPGDDADIIESKTPSTEFQAFTEAVIQVALKALDIPMCFFDESHTNFYGSRAAVLLYIKSCEAKRDALALILKRLTQWKIRQWIVAGKLILPAGMTPETVPYTWIHAGLPWWDPAKEVNADIQAVKGGFRCRADIVKERYGEDWYRVIDKIAAEEEYARKKGVNLESVVVQPVADSQDGQDSADGVSPKAKKRRVAA